MNWIRVDVGIGRDSSIGAMSEALGVSVPTTTGHTVLVYTAMAEGCLSGDLSTVKDSVIETWAMWRGKRGRFAAALRAHICTPEGVMRSWAKYNGSKLHEMEYDRERKRIARESARAQRREPGGRPADTTQTSGGRPPLRDVTGRDVTEQQGSKQLAASSVLATSTVAAAGGLADDQRLLTAAANAGLDQRYPHRNPIHASSGGSHRCADALRAAGVDPEFAAATIFAYASTLTAVEPPGSLAYFTRHVLDRWQGEQAKREAATYVPSSKPSPEVDQMRVFATRYAQQGSAEWQAYCDERQIPWREAA